jgi:outer membrane protein insertion porin family
MKRGSRFVRGLSIIGLVLGIGVMDVAPVVPTAGVAHAQTSSNIVVEGNRRVEASTIRSYFKPGPGGRFDANSLDQGYKSLFSTGLFLDIKIDQARDGRIIVTVVENPVINRIAFEGNNRVKDEQVKGEIQSKERGTLSRATVQSDVQRVAELYRRLGRFDASVEPKIIELPNNRVDLIFEIKEGDKTGVKTIEFVGNKTYSDYRLSEVIKTTKSSLLSFLSNTNIYDPDRLEADRDLLRRFYLKHGFIDVRIVTATAQYDPERRGFLIRFTIEEGEQYRVGSVNVASNIRRLDPASVSFRVRLAEGDVYNADALERSVEDITIEAARLGFAFATVRPRADRNYQARLVNLVLTVDEGQRVYIEQINIRGNTRTRDHVIRREFDLAEGDPYNRALINRAERRLKNLNYFKEVKVTAEPGSAPDRVIINAVVEEMSTGEFSISGGYSTSDGLMGEVSVGERNLLGLGLYAKASVQYGQHASGAQLSFVEPYLLGYRVALGVDIFTKLQKATNFTSYSTRTQGGNVRFGFSLREDLGLQLRYSIYDQKVTLPTALNNCNNINPSTGSANPTYPTNTAGIDPRTGEVWKDPATGFPFGQNCYLDGEASLAVRRELAQGSVLTSLIGYDLTYNTLDNNRNPTSGFLNVLKQDFAGVGGAVQFIRTTFDSRTFYEVIPDLIGVLHLQGGHIAGWGSGGLRMLDHFQMGPNLVRGFTPNGIGPRDLTVGTTQDALGGSMFWGASIEFQSPIYMMPKDSGVKVAAFADAGSLWSYRGPTSWMPPSPGATGEVLSVSNNNLFVNSSVGVGLLWASPFGPLRFDIAYPITAQHFDRKQVFRFSGGTSF